METLNGDQVGNDVANYYVGVTLADGEGAHSQSCKCYLAYLGTFTARKPQTNSIDRLRSVADGTTFIPSTALVAGMDDGRSGKLSQ